MSYESARPIESGCLALVLNNGDDLYGWAGLIVKVIEKAARDQMILEFGDWGDEWVINVPTEPDEHVCFCPEADLLRIDDDSIQIELEREQELEHA